MADLTELAGVFSLLQLNNFKYCQVNKLISENQTQSNEIYFTNMLGEKFGEGSWLKLSGCDFYLIISDSYTVEVPNRTRVRKSSLISSIYQQPQTQVVMNSNSQDPPKAVEGSPRWPSHGISFGHKWPQIEAPAFLKVVEMVRIGH